MYTRSFTFLRTHEPISATFSQILVHRISATISKFSLRCSTFIELVLCDRLFEYRRNKADIQI
jgi:hypothetical protein